METYTKAPAVGCPSCGARGCLSYLRVPAFERKFTNPKDGSETTDYFDQAKDFSCENCGAEFTLTTEGDKP